MAFLEASELTGTFYKKAANMDQDDLTTYLQRANAFAKGEIGGVPPTVDDDLKAAVAMAFEIMAQGESAQVDDVTGNITEAAPAGSYTRAKDKDPLDVVKGMLRPYKIAFEAANAAKSDRGVSFI
jgi:hypothetical protein